MKEECNNEKANSRNMFFAFLLSVLVPGLGQLYNGQLRKSAICAIGLLSLIIGFDLLGLKQYFWAYTALIIILFALCVAISIEAAVTAGRTKEYQIKNYNKWYVYLVIVLVWFIAVLTVERLLRTTRYKSFQVSTDSGNPNLIAGDYVLGDLGCYKTKEPEYGDLIVFSIPNGESQVFRIVGMPNDTLNIENQLVKYKNKKSVATFVSNLTWNDCDAEEFIETLPNGFKYRIYRNKIPHDSAIATIRNIIVPNDSYFVLGDNRDFSADSRFVGVIHKQQVHGKLLYIFFSTDFNKINNSLSSL